MPTPRLSVLMTSYNGERFLSDALESVLSQTFTDFEFIIVDDGSSDGSADIVRSFCARDKRVRGIFLEENVGIPRAANRGLRAVRAPLIARVDSDDICAPSRFAEQVSYMDEHSNIYMLGCRAVNIDEDDNKIEGVCDYKIAFVRGCRRISSHMRRGSHPLLHATLIYRTVAVREINGYNEVFPFGEDDDLYLRIFDRYGCVLDNLPQRLYFYRRHGSSISHKKSSGKHLLVQLLIRYSSECRVRGLFDPLAAPLSGRQKLSLSSLAISASERKKLEYRFFLRSIKHLPISEDRRQVFFIRFASALLYEPRHRQGCLPCIIVARECLRYGEYKYFMRYLLRAFYIDFIFTLYFFYARALAHLGR